MEAKDAQTEEKNLEYHYFDILQIDSVYPKTIREYKAEYDELVKYCKDNNIKVKNCSTTGSEFNIHSNSYEYFDDCTQNSIDEIKMKLRVLISKDKHDFGKGEGLLKYTICLGHKFRLDEINNDYIYMRYIYAKEQFTSEEIEIIKPYCRCEYHKYFEALKRSPCMMLCYCLILCCCCCRVSPAPCAGCVGCLQYESHGYDGDNMWLLKATKKQYEAKTKSKLH